MADDTRYVKWDDFVTNAVGVDFENRKRTARLLYRSLYKHALELGLGCELGPVDDDGISPVLFVLDDLRALAADPLRIHEFVERFGSAQADALHELVHYMDQTVSDE